VSTKSLNRREFLKTVGSAAAAAGVSGLPWGCGKPSGPAVHSSRPPNVIFLVTDQQRADALSASGNRRIITPHLDRLAGQGVHFTNCYSANPVCVPSRMSAFSGLYTHQHGTMHNRFEDLLTTVEGTILDLFLQRGYRTAWIGKNHTYVAPILESCDLYLPGGREKSRGKYPVDCTPWWHGCLAEGEEGGGACTGTSAAIEFMREHGDKPFFLNLNYFDPHPPYFCPGEFAGKYLAENLGLHHDPPAEQLDPRFLRFRSAFGLDGLPDEGLKETMRFYYGAVSYVDRQVGRILEEVDRLGLAGRTIIVFASDHGDFMGEFHMVRKAMFLYDALLRVPLIIRSPFGGKHLESDPVQLIDLLPTLCEVFGEAVPEGLPGKSLLPYLEGSRNLEPERHIYASARYGDTDPSVPIDRDNLRPGGWEEEPDWRIRQADILLDDLGETFMVATPQWKYIRNSGAVTRDELYARDPGKGDFINLIDDPRCSDVAASLLAELDAFCPGSNTPCAQVRGSAPGPRPAPGTGGGTGRPARGFSRAHAG